MVGVFTLLMILVRCSALFANTKLSASQHLQVLQLHCKDKFPDTFAPSADERDLRDARRAGAPRT